VPEGRGHDDASMIARVLGSIAAVQPRCAYLLWGDEGGPGYRE
jgi:hypothetical protein